MQLFVHWGNNIAKSNALICIFLDSIAADNGVFSAVGLTEKWKAFFPLSEPVNLEISNKLQHNQEKSNIKI